MEIGNGIEDYFEVEKNAQIARYKPTEVRTDLLYFISIKESGIKLKGQFIEIENNQFLFVCAPLIAAVKDLSKVGLNFLDFPMHDYFTDAMFLLRANEKTMVEVREFSNKIKTRNQELECKQEELQIAQDQLTDANEALEERVKIRTQELEETNAELSSAVESLKDTQDQLIESEKLGALGQLVAGIAHEINTPIGAINASIELLHQSITDSTSVQAELFRVLNRKEQEKFQRLVKELLKEKDSFTSREQRAMTKELRKNLEAAGLSHAGEVASTMGDYGCFSDLSDYYSLFQHTEIDLLIKALRNLGLQDQMSRIVKTSVSKADRVVSALKTYMDSQSESEVSQVNIVENLESVLVLHKSFIKQGVHVDKSYSSSEIMLDCHPNQLNQVWVNVIHNALQAMENHGVLTISTTSSDDLLIVKIADDGPGIPFDIQSKIFDPFFTTKKDGKGTGLGLNLVQKIIHRHHGEIKVESKPGKTTFTITLPGVKVKSSQVKTHGTSSVAF